MDRKLRIAIDCRITSFQQGVGTAVLALAKALSDSGGSRQEYTFIVRESMREWLIPYVYGPCRLEGVHEPAISTVKKAVRSIAPLRYIYHKYCDWTAYAPASDGFVESRHFDVVHFPTQVGYLTKLPTIYQPWDLQHLHYPQFFSKADFAQRERLYRAFCNQASYVCVQAEWTKKDLIYQYRMAEEKVIVVPWGSVFDAYKDPSEEEIVATAEKYGLPSCFFFYPAVTWPHKNHEVILRALHILKSEHGIAPEVFFTGLSTDHRSILDTLAKNLDISRQLHFLGFVSSAELQAIFRSATAMIFPSKFEGFGLPILEAFHAGLAVLSSNATTLPEVARDGALYFDPDSPAELSALMRIIMNEPEIRQDLITKGALVLSQYSIKDTAASFQQIYARTAALYSPDHRLSPPSVAVRQEE
jgi:glycosyltransferase involved in cell wall biosynthesis